MIFFFQTDFAYYCIQWGKGCYFDFNCLPCKQAKAILYDYSGNISAAQELQSLESEIYKQLKRPASTIIIRSICPKINVNTWWYSSLRHPQFRNTGRAETESAPRDVQRGEELGGVGEVLEEGNDAMCVFKVVCVLWKKRKR